MMRLSSATTLRRGLVALVAAAALAAPLGARASLLDGLSIRGGFWRSDRATVREAVGEVMWGGGLDYKIAHFPALLNGDQWSTSLSADFHYSEKKSSGVFRMIPVSVNQVYTFDQESSTSPYAGFFLSAVTINGTDQPTITRIGGGLLAGLNVAGSIYVEGRYQWVDSHGLDTSLPGLFGYVGYRF